MTEIIVNGQENCNLKNYIERNECIFRNVNQTKAASLRVRDRKIQPKKASVDSLGKANNAIPILDIN